MSTLTDYENAFESDNPETVRAGLQALINSGAAWKLEGSVGRAAMAAIESGACAVGREAHSDYWGNLVPSRDMLAPGSVGTIEYMKEQGYSLAE